MQSVDCFHASLISEGKDTFADFVRHGGCEYVREINELARTGVWDAIRGCLVTVEPVHCHDGACKRELLGLVSAQSKFSLVYSTMTQSQMKDFALAGPVTRTAAAMKAAEPPRGMSEEAAKARARSPDIAGVRAGNALMTGVDRVFMDLLHAEIRCCSTTLKHESRAIVSNGGDLDAFIEHLNVCVGVRGRVVWLDDSGPEVAIKGPDVRLLLADVDHVLHCRRQPRHVFLPSGPHAAAFDEAMSGVFRLLDRALAPLRQQDVDAAAASIPQTRKDLLKWGVSMQTVFGEQGVTPTERESVEQIPHHQTVSRPACVFGFVWRLTKTSSFASSLRVRAGAYVARAHACQAVR